MVKPTRPWSWSCIGSGSVGRRPLCVIGLHGCSRPRRRVFEDPGKDRAVGLVGAGQIADAHQKFTDDLPAGKAKGPAEELRPRLRRTRMMGREPKSERPV